MLEKLKKIIIGTLLTFSAITNAQALSSNGTDGAFLLNSELTLTVLDGDVFNFTTIDIGTNGILNLFGTPASSSFSMLASGDVHIAGIVNFFTNTNILSEGAIDVSGTLDMKNGSSITLMSANGLTISGNILRDGRPLLLVAAVPEPDVYSFLLLGLGLIGLRLRHKTIYG